MTKPLIPSRLLFRFSVTCQYGVLQWTDKGSPLDEKYRLLSLSELENQAEWADVRAAWHESGLAFQLIVHGKSQQPWFHADAVEDSDGLHLWIDTRDVHDVHRATRFCHRFAFLPHGISEKKGTGPICAQHPPGRSGKLDLSPFSQPTAEMLPINRAKEHPRPVGKGLLKTYCQMLPDGYILNALIPAEALTGFDPAEHPRLGFNYAVLDRELGVQTLSVGNPMPFRDDPSLWATLELQR